MKKLLLVLGSLWSLSSLAQGISLPDFRWEVTDISQKGLNKEEMFRTMNRTFVRLNDSICSNRAQVWAYDFKRHYQINTAKIFLFFTSKNGTYGNVTWWYHVTPAINERGKLYTMDAGFPSRVKSPLAIKDWLKEFTKEESCKEIRIGENELIEYIYKERVFPIKTSYGNYGCYYVVAPEGYWIPGGLAKNMLGYDENRRPVNYSREELNQNEVYQACLEVSTSPIGWALGEGHRKCRGYL